MHQNAISEATTTQTCIAFADDRRLADGSIQEVALALNAHFANQPNQRVLVFDAATSRPVELVVHGTREQVASRYTAAQKHIENTEGAQPAAEAKAEAEASPQKKAKRGRPKLGVVGREVTLLPRHWQWLAKQPGGASVTLRKLVEQARKRGAEAEQKREAQEAAYRFMVAIAGDRPGYEEALRALYAGKQDDFHQHTADWPVDIRDHAQRLANPAFHS